MAENMIKFLRGNVASLPQTATAGAVYFTKDEGLYLGLEDGTYHRYGDFITVADVKSLPATGAHETCMYYCVAENILAKWDGSEWVQINKQKTLAELGGVAKSVYEAKMALLEQADTNNATAIADLTTYVGTIPEGATATNVVAYVQEKTAGIAMNADLTELAGRVTTAEGEIDALQASLAEGGDTYKAIADAKKAGTDAAVAAKAAQDTADSKTTMAEVEAKGYATKTEAQGYADAKDTAIGNAQARADEAYALAETKTTMSEVIAKDYATKAEAKGYADAKDEAIAAAQSAADKAQGEVDALELKVGTVTEGKTVVEMIADAQAAATYDDGEVRGLISDNAEAIAAIEADYLKKADKDALQSQIDTIMNNPDTEGVINSINEFTQYVKDHGTIADGFRADIDANAKAISDHEELAAETYETKTDASAKLTEAKGYADTLNGAMDTRVAALEGINHNAYVAADETVLSSAKAYADGLDSAMDARMDVVEGKAHEHANKSELDLIVSGDKAKWDEAYAKRHEHSNKTVLDGITSEKVAAWDGAKAGAEATAAAALSAAKTELEGKITAEETRALAAEAKALSDAKTYADGLNGAMDTRVKVLEAIDHEAYKAYADTAEADAIATSKAYTESLLTWGSF